MTNDLATSTNADSSEDSRGLGASIMTPREITSELDKHIVGQASAKRAVAIALRNRWRRMNLSEALRHEVTPKNILMIGPTGVGKTEIARRLAKLAQAPFIKVEATKFTEVGYVGRDVESIIRDLVDSAVKMQREGEMRKVQILGQIAQKTACSTYLSHAQAAAMTPRKSRARVRYFARSYAKANSTTKKLRLLWPTRRSASILWRRRALRT